MSSLDPVTRKTLLDSLVLVHQGQAQQAVNVIQSLANAGTAVPDALFLLGTLLCMHGQAEQGLSLLKDSHRAGKHSDDIFFLLSSLLEPLGADGEKVRLFIQRNRLMPLQQAGGLTPVDTASTKMNLDLVEPWQFSRRMTSFFPNKQDQFSGDHDALVREYVLKGWLPDSPRFDARSRVLTIGSCFAEELRNYLREKDLWSDVLFVPPGLNNTFALRQFIEWCVTGERATDAYWYEETPTGMAIPWEPDEECARYRAILASIQGLVLTVGLAEVWEDRKTGGVFWRGVPRSIFDEDVHVCRLSTVEENHANLRRIIELIRSINPTVEIVVTLSPVPLKATNQPYSCISADSVSKSVLRVAIHQLMEEKLPGVNYWPSFEIVRWLGSHVDHAMFGEDGNTRHVNRGAVKMILDNFIRAYYAPATVTPP